MTVRVVITGPESTGKSTLTQALAEHFKVGFVSEYAREYLEKKLNHQNLQENQSKTPPYSESDLVEMLNGQVEKERQLIIKIRSRNTLPLLICDTDALTYKIWIEEVFKVKYSVIHKYVNHIFNIINKDQSPSIYLLCSPEGIKWQYDPLRENPNDRDRLFDIYQKNLALYQQSYFILRGPKEKRLAEAIKIINRFLK